MAREHAKLYVVVAESGLTLHQCSKYHYQIKGGERLVNIWPNSKRGFIFQSGDNAALKGNIHDAVAMARPPVKTEEPPPWEDPPVQRVGLIRWLWRLLW